VLARIEERNQVRYHDLIEKDLAVAVTGLRLKMRELIFDQPNEPPAYHLVFRARNGLNGIRGLFVLASHGSTLEHVDNPGASTFLL
jgi:hypothetical protein